MNDRPRKAENTSNEKLSSVQTHVATIWKRARSNAFAHRYASEKYKVRAEKLFHSQVVSGIAGVLLVLLVYLILSTEQIQFPGTNILAAFLTFSAVVCSILSLYFSIKQNYSGYERLHMIHNHNQHSYLNIAQRAREVAFPDIDLERAEAILEDLERDFQVLKARGQEPSHEDFSAGNALLYEIADKLPEGEMQSFKMHRASTEGDHLLEE